MPTYDYRCKSCKHEFEHVQSMSSPLLKKCPACKKAALERLIGTGAALILIPGFASGAWTWFRQTGELSKDFRVITFDPRGIGKSKIDKNELQHAIKKIAGGGIYFSAEVLDEMMKSEVRKKENEDAHLTNREKQIIRLIEKEYSNKKIAAELFLSERTVETHRKNIFRKTKTNSLIGLIKYAYEQKLI